MNKLAKKIGAAMIIACFTAPVLAIDNPDAPDYVGEFQQKVKVYETKVQEQAKTTQDYLKIYAEYEKFLDVELNNAYKMLVPKLGEEQQRKFKQAQRNWIKYRDVEFEFIAENWTAKKFGSSSALSRGAYRTTLIKDRVLSLLNYLKNY